MFDGRIDGFSTNGYWDRLSLEKWLRVQGVKPQKGLIEPENHQNLESPLEACMGPPIAIVQLSSKNSH